MFAVRLKGTNLFVYKTPNTHLLNEGSGSAWKNKPDILGMWGMGPWLEDMANALAIDRSDESEMDKLCSMHGDDLFEVVEVWFAVLP